MNDTKPIKTMRVKIKKGAPIFQNYRSSKWPVCCPPDSEYAGEEYQYVTKNPDREFEAQWDGQVWECKADGYGNGSIFVLEFDGVKPINTEPSIVMRNPKGILGAVIDLSECWVDYYKMAIRKDFELNTLIEDCLYKLGMAIDPEGYKGDDGFDKFIKDLKKWLDDK